MASLVLVVLWGGSAMALEHLIKQYTPTESQAKYATLNAVKPVFVRLPPPNENNIANRKTVDLGNNDYLFCDEIKVPQGDFTYNCVEMLEIWEMPSGEAYTGS